ncbi:hypothetical protein DFH11DRAFT_1759716 [Phellopilus nigrolimitatus]|nr:hypothetical protein DFH11DRAFT_1759716 [Phellopilus nigrolimitatus]
MPPVPAARQKGITATTLAVHHHLQCDLFLYNSYHGTSKNSARHWQESSELTRATLSRGDKWESSLFAWLDGKGLLLQVLGGFLEGPEIQEVIEIDERDHFFVSGLSFVPPASAFESKFRANHRAPVRFGVAKPDLVEIRKEKDGTIRWQVVDAKSSVAVKTSHHVQIYFYHVCLENLFSSHYKPMGTAAVWIPPSVHGATEPSFDELNSIATPLLSLPLNEFLFNKLPEILSLKRDEVKWHLNPLCHGCAFEHECSRKAMHDGELGAMANISIQDASVLRNVLAMTKEQSFGSPTISDIEDLYTTVRSKAGMVELERSHPSTMKKAKQILKIHGNTSPVIDAARLKQIQVLNKRIFTLPSEEDIAIVISLVLDPATNNIAAFGITTYSNLEPKVSPGPLCGTSADFTDAIASIIQYVLDLNEVRTVPPRTQCYVYSQAERAALQRALIDASLIVDPLDDDRQDALRMCVGALCEGAALLATSFQPLVLSGALLDFLKKTGGRTTAELQTCLRRLGLPYKKGSNEELRQRIQDELDRLKALGKSMKSSDTDDSAESNESGPSGPSGPSGRPEVGQLPRVVVLKRAIEQLLALPTPGYWDLPGCHSILMTGSANSSSCPSDDDLYVAFVANRQAELKSMMQMRNLCIYEVLTEARQRATNPLDGEIKKDILVNEARVLTSEFMDICRQDHLRKLFFMQQFEVLAKLNNLWQDRIDGCVDAPRLEYLFTNRMPDNSYIHYFSLCSGYVDLPSDKERTFYGYILTEDEDSDLPVEALFDDLAVFNLVFPLNRYTKARWDKQPIAVKKKVFIADVHDMVIRNFKTLVVLRTFGEFNLRLKSHARYRLSPRLVDFNVTKMLSTLVELDLQTPTHPGYMSMPPFLQLFSDPRAFSKLSSESPSIADEYDKAEGSIQSRFRELSGLGNEAATSLIFKPSQRRALKRILKHRLSVIWGPPGKC